jgi:hypothetical protein
MDRPSVRATSAVLLGGTLLSAAFFVLGFVLSLGGSGAQPADPRALDAVLRSALALEPWGLSMVGVLALLATPAAGLLVTSLETRRGQPLTAALALLVLAILLGAALIALAV